MNPHLLRARLLIEQDRYELAVTELRQALVVDPLDPQIHQAMAIALLRLGKWRDAMDSAKIALEHAPDDPMSHWVQAVVLLDRSQLPEAESTIRRAIELDPDDADYHGMLARIHYERNNYPAALAAADAGLALEADHDLSLTYRTRALSSLGRHEEAEGVTESLLREDPLDAWNHCLRGEDLLLKGDADQARVHFLEALRLSPGNGSARSGYATALKARNPLYGTILAFLLYIGRQKTHYLWGALIGIFALFQFGPGLVKDSPIGIVALEVVNASLLTICVLCILANPIFDLILRFHPEGRHVLSASEKRATTWYLVCFTLAALSAFWALRVQNPHVARFTGYAFLYLCSPIREIFETSSLYVRTRLLIPTLFLGILLIAFPFLIPVGIAVAFAKGYDSLAVLLYKSFFWLPLVVMLYSAFADDIANWLNARRPD